MWTSMGLNPIEQMIAMERIGTRARVQEVGEGPPILLVHGTGVGGASWAPLVAVPNAELKLWPGVGHAPWIDHPERAAASVTEFLDA